MKNTQFIYLDWYIWYLLLDQAQSQAIIYVLKKGCSVSGRVGRTTSTICLTKRYESSIINKLSVLYFSVLTNWVLHYAGAVGLFPFWFAWRESSDLLLLGTWASWRSTRVTHYVVMQTLALRNHVGKAACVRKHLVLALSTNKVIGNQALLLGVAWLLVALVAGCGGLCVRLILVLSFNIHWRLWSYPVLCWGRTRLLWIASLLCHHLTVQSMSLIAAASHVSIKQIIMLLCQAKWIGRWTIDVMCIFLICDSLSVWTRWPLLGSAWTETIIVVLAWAKTTLPSLVWLVCIGALATRHGLPASHNVARGLYAVILVHLVVKSCGSDWTTWLENSQLLLIQDLRVCETLVRIGLTQMWWTHDLLRHHQIICLRSIDSFLTLDRANAELRILQSTWSMLADGTNAADSSWHLCTLCSELLDGSWSIWAILPWHLWAVALQSDHAGTNTDDLIVADLSLAVCKVLITATSDASLMTLVCETATHHGLLRWPLANHMMAHMSTHTHSIVFDDCDATRALKMWWLTNALVVILLSLNNVATEHLGILYLNLRIVENIIIVVDVLYNFNRLVPFLFLWLRGATSPLMRSMQWVT